MSKHLNLKSLRNPKKSKHHQHELNNVDNEKSRFFMSVDDDDDDDGNGRKFRSNNSEAKFVETTEQIVDNNASLKTTEASKKMKNSGRINDPNIRNGKIPQMWKIQLENIREMRRCRSAPVDEMGCHKCADELAEGPIFRFQTLIALMLSSQTKDKVTFEAMQRLKEVNCVPEVLVSIPDEELGKIIYPVSFWKRKVRYLKKTAEILKEEYSSDIPNSVEALCALPGVGPKMAHICMQVAWNKITGIGVDTHVHRISNRLQWVPKPTKNPEETRIALESWLPKSYWAEINHLFVGFGQDICQPRNPKCSNCSNQTICPYAIKKYQF